MAVSTVEQNNKLVKFTKQINREYVRGNLFSPYMGTGLNAIIRMRNELKAGGEQMNIPLVAALDGQGTASGTLVGNEEAIDDYGMRVWIDWLRHALVTKKNEKHKDSADVFEEARPLLSDWGRSKQRDELIEAFMALPSTAEPSGLGTQSGQRVNGLKYEDAAAAQKNTWNQNNSDRIVYGNSVANFDNTHATALANLTTADDTFKGATTDLWKRVAKQANPKIRPFKTEDGREYFVAFCDSYAFRDYQEDMATIDRDGRPREGRGMDKNPLFQDGDELYHGVIVREIPEMTEFVDDVWGLSTAGDSSSRVSPVFFCGQSAATVAWGQMARPTTRKEDDYGFIDGRGIEMAYGIAKMFKKHPKTSSILKQWGMLTGFVSAAADA